VEHYALNGGPGLKFQSACAYGPCCGLKVGKLVFSIALNKVKLVLAIINVC